MSIGKEKIKLDGNLVLDIVKRVLLNEIDANKAEYKDLLQRAMRENSLFRPDVWERRLKEYVKIKKAVENVDTFEELVDLFKGLTY